MVINNLNKENFWNEIEKQYPKAFEKFSKWIDGYKKEVEWLILFDSIKREECDIKFHDIPKEMQIGIIMKFMSEELMGKENMKEAFDLKFIMTFVEGVFSEINKQSDGKKRNNVS